MKFTIGATSTHIPKHRSDWESFYSKRIALCDFLEKLPLTDDGQIIEINSLEELAELQKQFDEELIIDFRETPYPTIEIYNGYRE